MNYHILKIEAEIDNNNQAKKEKLQAHCCKKFDMALEALKTTLNDLGRYHEMPGLRSLIKYLETVE